MKKVSFPLIKLLNTLIVLCPFLVCWYLYYEPRTITVRSTQVSVLLIIIFCMIFYYLCLKLDGFRASILRIGEIVVSQALSAAIRDLVMYVIIWMQSPRIPNPLWGFAAFGADCP